MLQVPLYTFSPVARSGVAATVCGLTSFGCGAEGSFGAAATSGVAAVAGTATALSLPPHPGKSASEGGTISICFCMLVVILQLAHCKLFGCSGKHLRSERPMRFRHGIPHHIVHRRLDLVLG